MIARSDGHRLGENRWMDILPTSKELGKAQSATSYEQQKAKQENEALVLNFLKRQPGTKYDIVEELDLSFRTVQDILQVLLRDRKIELHGFDKQKRIYAVSK